MLLLGFASVLADAGFLVKTTARPPHAPQTDP